MASVRDIGQRREGYPLQSWGKAVSSRRGCLLFAVGLSVLRFCGVRLLLWGCLSFAAGLGVAFRGGVGRWAGSLVWAAGIAKLLIHALV